jgi:conjugal transfer pilus assembly protein TrbC
MKEVKKINRIKIIAKIIAILILTFSNNVCAEILIFVSHSMNDEALKAYFKEAQNNNATLIMRGLINNSFIETKKKCEELKISYDINPILFEDFKIEVVPVIIERKGEIVKKLTGHISLNDALIIFNEDLSEKN